MSATTVAVSELLNINANTQRTDLSLSLQRILLAMFMLSLGMRRTHRRHYRTLQVDFMRGNPS